MAAALFAALQAGDASALQPLSEFLTGAHKASVDERESALAAVEQESESLVALGRALPSLSARGTYTRNQFEASFPVSPTQNLVIQPLDQFDAFLELDVPIVDLAAWARTRAARANARAARHNARATLLVVETQVARNYYQLIGAEALRRSAERSLAAAKENHALMVERRKAGVATELDVARAAAETERARQSIVDAGLLSQLSRRALRTITGIMADEQVDPMVDELQEEAPLAAWEGTPDERIPQLLAAPAQRRGAEASARAAKLALLPTITGIAQDRFTNATAFLLGHNSVYSLVLSLNWKLDFSAFANARTQSRLAGIARLREERARLAAHDQIFEAWQRVHADVAKSRAARAQARAAQLAFDFARERRESGAGTQLELIQAQRDAFAADVARIQADADLALARAVLRLSAGQPLDMEHAS